MTIAVNASTSLSVTDGPANRVAIQRLLDAGGAHVLPPGRIPIAGGLVLPEGTSLSGSVGTVLHRTDHAVEPLIHIIGGRTRIDDLAIELAPTGGARTGFESAAVILGDHLYPAAATWISDVVIRRLRIDRCEPSAATGIAVLGAVETITLSEIDVSGGGTAVAVHWGTIAATSSGPTYHPHHVGIDRLRVRDAGEGFALTSVHDVTVSDVHCERVGTGFSVRPGEHTDRFHAGPGPSQVSQRIAIREVRIGFHGANGMSVAGWGRSGFDGAMRRLPYRDTAISGCELTALAPASGVPRRRAGIVLEHVENVRFVEITVSDTGDVAAATVDGRGVPLAAVVTTPRQK